MRQEQFLFLVKKTVVIGASENPARYSNRVTRMLHRQNIPVIAIGLKAGEIDGVKIQTGLPKLENVDTVTLYVGEKNQPQYYEYILFFKPFLVNITPTIHVSIIPCRRECDRFNHPKYRHHRNRIISKSKFKMQMSKFMPKGQAFWGCWGF